MASERYNFAIFRENVGDGILYQAHGLSPEGWMPLASPTEYRHIARNDAWNGWYELVRRKILTGGTFHLDPHLRHYDWTERRQLWHTT